MTKREKPARAKKKPVSGFRKKFFFILRATLLLSVFLNLGMGAYIVLRDGDVSQSEVVEELNERLEYIVWALVTFVLTYGTSYIEKNRKINIPDVLEVVITLFIYAGIFLSNQFNLYYKFWWWDDLLHFFSGIIIGFIGFIVIYLINHNYSMDISPLLVAFFTFTFAVTLGVFWEIGEFALDALLGHDHQKWGLPPDSFLLGKPYQGSGLRDTMSDLIVDCLGALITSFITYFAYKKDKKRTLEQMKTIINTEE